MAKISPKQQRAALAIAAGKPVAEAAKVAKVSLHTVYIWGRQAAFRTSVADARTRIFEESADRLAQGMSKAAARLMALTQHEDPSIALRASIAVLDHAVRLREHGSLAADVLDLKRIAIEKGEA